MNTATLISLRHMGQAGGGFASGNIEHIGYYLSLRSKTHALRLTEAP